MAPHTKAHQTIRRMTRNRKRKKKREKKAKERAFQSERMAREIGPDYLADRQD